MAQTTLHVRTWGDGEPVVLIHGSSSPDAAHTWEKQRDLADRYRLLVPDRRGYGQSPAGAFRDVEGEVQDLIDLLDGGAHLVGLSYGGILAMLVTAKRPDLVRSLTVIEPPAFAVARGIQAVENLIERLAGVYGTAHQSTPEAFARGFAKGLLDRDLPDPLILPPVMQAATAAHMNEAAPWEIPIPLGALAATPVPKLVVTGQWHPAFSAVADVLTERLSAERADIGEAGHGVQHTGEPFNDRLIAFWQAHS